MRYISGRKVTMTQIWKNDAVIPVTVIAIEQKHHEMTAALEEGKRVTVRGVTKGRGFQGVVKRHGFAGGPKTHGQKNRHRAPGSIGATAPQRVPPGRRMAGRMGNQRVTIKNLEVVAIDKEKGLLSVRGALPGARTGKVEIRVA